jgi:acyl-CoA reductase-like NAD-dependent aldehyde dehydrogenase
MTIDDGAAIGLIIDGEVVRGDGGTYPVHNPARPAEVVFDAPTASTEQVDRAVESARHAQLGWAALPRAERAALVCKATQSAATLVESAGLAALLTREHGKVLWESQFDAGTIGGMGAAFAPLVDDALAERTWIDGQRVNRVVREPLGVVAAILPFNWPLSVLANKALPALLVGNTVVVKTPPTCPTAVLALAAALAGALPPGVLNTINGPGPEIGQTLVNHAGVGVVSLTGGVDTGRAVMSQAAKGLTPLVLELGGNDPAILAPDVEIDADLAGRLFDAAFITSGQVCTAIKRVYVPHGKVDSLVEALVERASQELVGDGLTEGVTMGPVHHASGRRRVERMLEQAAALGARVHRPASIRPEDAEGGGYFVSPAIVEGAPDHADIVAQEQFAPALPVLGYADIGEAIARGNDSSFGLGASIWTDDETLAADVADRLQAGTVFVNSHGPGAMDFRAPFGGWKQSGFGLELGTEGMLAFTRPKAILGGAMRRQ